MPQPLTLDVLVTANDRKAALSEDVRAGLTGADKAVPPVWFYDEIGSRLFDEITRLPEYYPTRAERTVLAARAEEIAELSEAEVLVELGSGTSEKTRLLLDAMAERQRLRQVVLLDISEEVLREAADALTSSYGVPVHAVVGDFRRHVEAIGHGSRRLWAFLGSTIGNLGPSERHDLLAQLRAAMSEHDHLLVGTDLVKAPERLVAAYDDAAGVTAAFNRNLLSVLNRELGADLDEELFEHRAVWNAPEAQIEMHLVAREAHAAHIDALDLEVTFEKGEEILTETSAKFRPGQVDEELAAAGLVVEAAWQDPPGDFQVTLACADPRSAAR